MFKISFILAGSLLIASISQASADRFKTINCTFSESHYGLSAARLTIDKSAHLRAEEKDGVYKIKISESECEDSTSIDIEDAKALADYKAGRIFKAQVSHETPDVKIEGYATCQQKK